MCAALCCPAPFPTVAHDPGPSSRGPGLFAGWRAPVHVVANLLLGSVC